jgi:hypothetical protein
MSEAVYKKIAEYLGREDASEKTVGIFESGKQAIDES